MSKKKPAEDETVQLGIRFTKGLVRQIDAFLEQFKKDNPGLVLNRSDAVRTLVVRAIDEAKKNGIEICDAMEGARGCRRERGHDGEHWWSP